jgi:hypothetical protein
MKTTTLTVAAAAIVMFAQSASAREYHHGTIITTIMWPRAGAHLGKRDRLVRRCQMDCLALPRRMRPSIGPYRRTMAATKRGPQRGAAGRCGDWSGLIPVRATTSRATGPIGAGRGPRKSALWSCAAPRRKDRRSTKRPMDHRIRQRRPCGSLPPSLDRGRDCDPVGLIALRHDPEKWIPVFGKDHAHSTS